MLRKTIVQTEKGFETAVNKFYLLFHKTPHTQPCVAMHDIVTANPVFVELPELRSFPC